MGIWHERNLAKSSFKKFKKTVHYSSLKYCNNSQTFIVGLTDNATPSNLYYDKFKSLHIAIDGEIDNISTLSHQLSCLDTAVEVIAALYLGKGTKGLYELKGTASIIIYLPLEEKTILYCCFLKGYPLYFTIKNNHLSVSTNPIYILHRDDISGKIDNIELGKYFALDINHFEGKIFQEIEAVSHGELVLISSEGTIRQKKSIEEMFNEEADYTLEEKSLEQYRTLFQSAVDTTIEAGKKYGIMLSSGMDSTSIAVFAAKKLNAMGAQLTAYSFTYPDDTAADETKKIRELCEKYNIELKLIDGETLGIFDSLDNMFLLPDTPFTHPYTYPTKELYRIASEDGIEMLFNGGYADMLFPQVSNSLVELLRDRKYTLIYSIVKDAFKRHGWKAVKRSPEIRNFIKGLLLMKTKPFSFGDEWLTESTKKLLQGSKDNIEISDLEMALTPIQSTYLGYDRYISEPFGFRRIEPHRNKELIFYSLGFPSYMTYRYGQKKYFAREAMRGLLPESIRTQPRAGNIVPFAMRSFQRNREKIIKIIWENSSAWNPYVKEEWMQEKLSENADLQYPDLIIIWLSLHIGPWLKAIQPGGSLYESEC